GFTSYAGTQSDIHAVITGGTLRESHQVPLPGGDAVVLGRWEGASIGFFGPSVQVPGGVHWIVAPSAFPPFLSDLLTGTATYQLASATSPTNQNTTIGTLASATLNVNFTNRTLGALLQITMPAAGTNGGC